MRTAIYVAEPSTVTIRPTAPGQTGETGATLYRFQRGAGKPALGTHQLEPGIYMVLSIGGVDVTGNGLTVTPLSKDKDIPPEPKAQVLAAEPGATPDAIARFFQVTKDADPPDPRAPAIPEDEPGMFDDEDDVEDD